MQIPDYPNMAGGGMRDKTRIYNSSCHLRAMTQLLISFRST